MAKLCELVDQNTNQCLQWVEHSYVPTLTNADRDAMIVWAVGIFAVVYVVRQLLRLL